MATVFIFEDDDPVGDLPLELVRASGGKFIVSEITLYPDVADVEAGSYIVLFYIIATIRLIPLSLLDYAYTRALPVAANYPAIN